MRTINLILLASLLIMGLTRKASGAPATEPGDISVGNPSEICIKLVEADIKNTRSRLFQRLGLRESWANALAEVSFYVGGPQAAQAMGERLKPCLDLKKMDM